MKENLSEIKNIFSLIEDAEEARTNYRLSIGSECARDQMDALTEVYIRLRELGYCFHKIVDNSYITGNYPGPTENQTTLLTDTEELRFFIEAFYNSAWRIRKIVEYLTKKDWPWDGISMVRCKLIEHCQDGKLGDNPILINSLSYDEVRGPKLKGLRYEDQAGEKGEFHDQGLFENARRFLQTLKNKFDALS